jgi:hypothetical protein
MAISSNALFHFTSNRKNLLGILKNAFIPKFCLEDFSFLTTQNDLCCYEFAFPMVCFCDLPLSNIIDHIKFYGGYGIGLKKNWGIKKGITPITYLTKRSYLAKHLKTYIENSCRGEESKDFPTKLIRYTKPVEGRTLRNGKYNRKIFYDEREWRYIPQLLDDRPSILPKDEYRINLANCDMNWRDRLEFNANDIKYIIVKHEKEILPMANMIRTIKRSKYDENQILLLVSRIIISKQIVTDF